MGESKERPAGIGEIQKFSDALMVAIFPGAAYCVAFWYEKGYAAFFGIPDYLLKVSLENFFVALIVVLAIPFTIFWFLNALAIMVPIVHHRLFFLRFYGLLGLAVCAVLGSSSLRGFIFNFMVLIAAAGFTVLLVHRLSSPRMRSTRLETLDDLLTLKFFHGESLFKKLHKKIGAPNLIALIVVLAIIPLLAARSGYYIASKTEFFLTTVIDHKPYALVRKYDNTLVHVGIERKWISLYESKPAIGHTLLISEVDHDPRIYRWFALNPVK